MMNYKNDFPVFKNNPGLVYLDTAATAQKPQCVIDAEMNVYETCYAGVHRGVYGLAERATALYEGTRKKIQGLINAKSLHEIIFTKGSTEAINLVAHSFGSTHVKAGDEIIVSTMEHHANILPWQQLCERVGASLKVIRLLENGELDSDHYHSLLTNKTKLVAVSHASNVLGTINPIKEMITAAHEKNIPVLIDGAQAIAHMPVDVQALDCDFYVFSSHKMYGPSGVGVLYAKTQWLEKMIPYQLGGGMVHRVTFEKTEFGDLPSLFEPGTPNIVGVIGLGAAIDYMNNIGFDVMHAHEKNILDYATKQLSQFEGLTIYGTSANKAAVISFALDGVHPHDIATILAKDNVCVRAGHHCAMPLMERLEESALTRASFALYNDKSDVDALVLSLKNVKNIFLDKVSVTV